MVSFKIALGLDNMYELGLVFDVLYPRQSFSSDGRFCEGKREQVTDQFLVEVLGFLLLVLELLLVVLKFFFLLVRNAKLRIKNLNM
jgi:hypothetical protein